MALFDNQKLKGALSKAKDSVTKVTKDAVQSISDTAKETSNALKDAKAEKDMYDAPAEGAIQRYEVIYKGGLLKYQNVKKTTGSFGLNIMNDGIMLKTGYTSKEWFEDLFIEYDRIKKIVIVESTISNAEWLLSSSSSDMKAMEQKNNIEITYEDGCEVVLRLEMLTGTSIYGQAGKCREMIDVLRQNGLLDKLKKESTASANVNDNNALAQIEKLGELLKSGILTEDEFNQKKKELLSRM